MQVFKPVFLLLWAGSALPLLADEHRQHGAHEHGAGMLDIAQEGDALHIELDSLAVNIVGFEHAPSNKEDHETLERALARLRGGAGLFALTEAAGCRLVDANVQTPLADHDEDEQDPAEQKHHAERERRHEHEEGYEHEETHADITAVYRFTCAHPEALDGVDVQLFDHFPMTERLRVQYITEEHQGAVELTASQPVVRF